MRKYGKTDRNHPQIVRELRKLGHSVLSLADIGGGAPDILVGRAERCWLFEIKDPDQPPSGRALTEAEVKFHSLWKGQIAVIETTEQALKIMEIR